MKYLGIARIEQGKVILPDTFQELESVPEYEVIAVGGDLLLITPPLDRTRLARIARLTEKSITDHRQTLEGLAR